MTWTVGQLLEATRGELAVGDPLTPVAGVSLDSRCVQAREAFLALRGDRFDAHEFIPEALRRGSCCLIVSRVPSRLAASNGRPGANGHGAPSPASPVATILVDDTTQALGAIASFHRARFQAPVIAVTGSCGKTTTKELLAHLLGASRRVLKTEGTQNNQIGLPLTLLRLSPAHQAAVVELGSNHPGEIAYLASMARPTVAVITNIGPAHLEFFGSMTGVFQEKLSLVEHLGPDGVAVVPGDQLDVLLEVKRRLPTGARMLTFGTSAQCGFQATEIRRRGSSWTFQLRDLPEVFTAPLPGAHNVENAVAALAAASVVGVPPADLRDALAGFQSLAMRSEVIRCGSVTLLNDCYNANPLSFARSLEVLEELEAARKVVIAGDMCELGGYADTAHRAIGRMAAQCGVEVLLAVGAHAERMREGALEGGCRQVLTFREVSDALPALSGVLRDGDAVLVKGSRRMQLERISAQIRQRFGSEGSGGAVAGVSCATD